MKRILILAIIVAAGCTMINDSVEAQISVSINIGSQPEWGPTGYDYVEFYYLPDLDMYYDVPNHRFYYLSGDRWRYSTALPAQYRNIDLYSMHKVVVNDRNPFQHHAAYQQQYAQFKNRHDQQPIRDAKENKYSSNRNNWQNNRYTQPTGHAQENRPQPNADAHNPQREVQTSHPQQHTQTGNPQSGNPQGHSQTGRVQGNVRQGNNNGGQGENRDNRR